MKDRKQNVKKTTKTDVLKEWQTVHDETNKIDKRMASL